jgi:hypothetical protein
VSSVPEKGKEGLRMKNSASSFPTPYSPLPTPSLEVYSPENIVCIKSQTNKLNSFGFLSKSKGEIP